MKDLRKGKVSLGLVLCFFLALPLLLSSSGFCQDDYVFVLKWGSYGDADGKFYLPTGVAIDLFGNVYVADTENYRIQKFDSEGNFLTKWGSFGKANGQFRRPYDVAVDLFGNVYVADTYNHRVQKFDSNGNFITKWGGLDVPRGIAVDMYGNMYVSSDGTSDIRKFDSNGNFITKWGSYGTGNGQFRRPAGVAVDLLGNVYVADFHNSRIQKFDSEGNFLKKWRWGGSPWGIDVDLFGNVYVSDIGIYCIWKFDSNGTFITKLGSHGNGDGQFRRPRGVAVGLFGNVYVSDTDLHRIQKFAPVDIPSILSFFDANIENGTLMGSGPGNSWHRMKALRNMLKAAGELVEEGLIAEACQQLLDAYNRCDGQPKPPDFVEGEASPQLAGMIQTYRAYLGCNQ